MNIYRTVVLDYGGVYSYEYTIKNYERGMLQAFGMVPTRRDRDLLRSAFADLSTGRGDCRDYIATVARMLQTPRLPTEAEFQEAIVSETLMPSPEMIELRIRLQLEGIYTVLLSDMCDFELRQTRGTGRFDGFDFTSFSFGSGYIKQQRECFIKLAQDAQLDPSTTLFVDDSEANIHTAEEAGYGVLYASKTRFLSSAALAKAIGEETGLSHRAQTTTVGRL
jgi:FMN phosphatase YigB (HAD superfamily)